MQSKDEYIDGDMFLTCRFAEWERLEELEGEELRNWFAKYHFSRLDPKLQAKVLLRFTDEELREISMLWQYGSDKDNADAEKMFYRIMRRGTLH